ncbi:PhzF family phenazine biosynthesis protein [Lacibacter sediminis]|uniref:PhzF family phenazine biosynthesis protein n=1 Tax=Lacibacter sediminis TaxID=2760713 RepID=A0A7G5XCV4_9BACT|nr:PhzF family phenazine biosynthesis protein [Lacibacter sediminis]QNA43307.1 PhzF family phenazine biosynthesis protein [Lacibacter sediminis]
MKLSLYQVDAFTSTLFKGNPAAVVPLEKWIDDELMQKLAMENNLAETVFFVPSKTEGADYDIRWFTPELEINLCGHATLASAFVLYTQLGYNKPSVTFSSKSGLLTVEKNGTNYEMDFPSWKPERINDYPEGIAEILGVKEILGAYKYRDLMIEVATEEEVVNAKPDFTAMKKTGEMIILTAKGNTVDFVSRFFAPTAGIDEDPVTGSAHSQLIPFWSEKLDKKRMIAKQLSKRGGDIICEQKNTERLMMGGECVFYMKGEFEIAG